MADNLVFPIGFDLEGAVKKAGAEWDNTYASKLEKLLARRPVAVNLDFGKLEDVKKRLAALKIEPVTPETKAAIKALTRELQTLAKALEAVQKYSGSRGAASADAVRASKIKLNEERSKAQAALAAQRAAREEANLAQARLRDAQAANVGTSATRKLSGAYHEQNSYLQRLIQRMAVYASVGTISNFVTQIREVTAEFELQRISLGAIIQDQQRANLLFAEIKSYALESPVKLLDLTKYTKQLAAYKIDVDDLFDTTKRLTDISVGLGVSMDRIVLMYGQIRATGYLRASEVRQATEAGIPLVEELAKKLSSINGELVTAADVMEMISKRQISFEQVKEVFDDMTSAGGMFYNMQEKLGNTLAGMWAKLGDAAAVMFDEIGREPEINKGMRELIELLTELMRNWKATAAAMGVGLGSVAIIYSWVRAYKFVAAAVAAHKEAKAKETLATQQYERALRRLNQALSTGTMKEKEAAAAALQAARARQQAAQKAVKATSLWRKAVWGVGKFIGGGALAAGVGFLMDWAYGAVKAREEATRLRKELSRIKSDASTNMITAVNNFNALAKAAVNAADGSKEQADALDELKRTYGHIIPEQDLAIDRLEQLKGHYESLTVAIKEQIAMQAKQESISAFTEEYAPKRKKARRHARNVIKSYRGPMDLLLFDDRQTERILENMERLIDKGGKWRSSFYEAIRMEGFDKDNADELAAHNDLIVYGKLLEEMRDGIKKIEDEFAPLEGELGQFADRWMELERDWSDGVLTKGERIRGFLESVIGYKEIDELAKEYGMASKYFWEAVEKAALGSPEKSAAIGLAKKKFFSYTPEDEVVRKWKGYGDELARSLNHYGNEMDKFFIKDGESLKDYRKRLEDSLQALLISYATYTATRNIILNKGGNTKEQDENLKRVAEEREWIEKMLKGLPTFPDKSSRTSKTDPRLQNLKEEISLLQKLHKEYKELAVKAGSAKAYQGINSMAKETIGMFKDKYGISLPTTATDLAAGLDILYDKMAKLPKKKFPSLEKDLKELRWTIERINIDAEQERIEKTLQAIADRISRTKTAKEFYEKILGQTGNVELAANVAVHIYGEQGKDLDKQVRKQIEYLVEQSSATLDYSIFRADDTFDPRKLREFAEANKTRLGEDGKAYQELIKLADNAEKDFAKTIEDWLKATEKAKTYTDKMLDLARTTRTEIDAITTRKGHAESRIAELLGMGELNASQSEELKQLQGFLATADNLIQGFKDKQAKEQGSLMYEAFKDSPMYVQMFDDLDHASTQMLENMKSRMEGLKEQWKNLTPTQLKEMQSRMNEIDQQLAKRNPFKTLSDSIKRYHDYMKKGEPDSGTKSAGDANALLAATAKAADDARIKYDELVKKYGEGSEETVQEVIDAKNELDEALANEEAAQKAVENWKKVKDMIGLSANELFRMLNWAGDIAKGIADISQAMGADEEDVQYWNDVASALSDISGGVQDIVQAAMNLDVVGAVSSVLTAVPKMFVGVTNLFRANTIRKANKEIRRQGEILEQLEYTYGRLENAKERAFSVDYIRNFGKELKTLRAEAEAYRKQAEAERSKGKSKDKEALKNYENSYRETLDTIEEKQRELVERFSGTSRTDLARQMAQSWLEARVSMADTFTAIKSDYTDMIQSMIVEGAAARIVDQALAPMWESMDSLLGKGDIDGAIDMLVGGLDSFVGAANSGLEVLFQRLESRGLDLMSLLGEDGDGTSGMAREVANATSEEINANTAALNTQNFYISQTLDEVRAIRMIIASGVTPSTPAGGIDMSAIHEAYTHNLTAISRHTAETVAECRLIAERTNSVLSILRRVVNQNGGAAKIRVEL